MENFPQSFEPVGSDSILEQFVQLKHNLNDKLVSNEFVKTIKQTLTEEQKKQARENIGAGSATINVIDNVTSSSTTEPLSANQGRVLNEKINTDVESLRRATTTIVGQLQNQIDDNIEDISELFQQNARALKTPMTRPTETELVAVDSTNSQTGLKVGEAFTIYNGVLNTKFEIKEIYNMSSINSNINLGYTSGILSQTLLTAMVDFSEDDFLIVEYCCFKGNNNGNTGGRQNVLLCGLKQRNNLNACSACSMVGYINSEEPSVQTPYFMFKFQCNPDDNNFIGYFAYNGELKPNDESYYISRIYSLKMGV